MSKHPPPVQSNPPESTKIVPIVAIALGIWLAWSPFSAILCQLTNNWLCLDPGGHVGGGSILGHYLPALDGSSITGAVLIFVGVRGLIR